MKTVLRVTQSTGNMVSGKKDVIVGFLNVILMLCVLESFLFLPSTTVEAPSLNGYLNNAE